MFGPVLSMTQSPLEARLAAEALESLARALRDWSPDTWRQVRDTAREPRSETLFERLVAQAAPLALHPRQRREAIRSAETTAAVLRCLWPDTPRPAVMGSGTTLERVLAEARGD